MRHPDEIPRRKNMSYPHKLLACTLLMLFVSPGWADAEPRTISVAGSAVVSIAPDFARVAMTIIERDESLASAQATVAAKTNSVLELLDELSIARKYINTAGATLRPNYRWNRNTEEQELLGYIVERRIQVEVRDLDKLGALIEQATKAGVNELSPPQLDSSKRKDAQREALANAVADARLNAATIAMAANGTLGDARYISTTGGIAPPRPMARMQADALSVSAATESYVPGEIKISASVSAVYELLDGPIFADDLVSRTVEGAEIGRSNGSSFGWLLLPLIGLWLVRRRRA
jgi:uncharacterized protein YggE